MRPSLGLAFAVRPGHDDAVARTRALPTEGEDRTRATFAAIIHKYSLLQASSRQHVINRAVRKSRIPLDKGARPFPRRIL